MKILVAYPKWDNRWIPYFKKTLSCYDTKFFPSEDFSLNSLWEESLKADVLISMWSDEIPAFWSTYFADKKIITYLRRYELYTKQMVNTKWNNVDAVIFVSEFIRQCFNETLTTGKPKKTYVIPNAIDFEQFTFENHDRKPTKIAFVCTYITHKNFGLATQILLSLPDEYTLHYIGRKR
jgi:glycosyltransferase involved in cell wall biosynthesis